MPSILPPCKLVELDLAGVEAVMLGWYAARLTDNPLVIRAAKLGLHALVASHVLKRPADLTLSDAELTAYFKHLKKTEFQTYDTCKRVVHGTGYGMTPEGMALMFPKTFSSVKYAETIQAVYFTACPPVPAFQLAVRQQAAKVNRLGGPPRAGTDVLADPWAHPYTYEHAFWNVVEYRKLSPNQARLWKRNPKALGAPVVEINGVPHAMKWGPDSKRVLAFYPQSTGTGGKIHDDAIELFEEPDGLHYIGDYYYGRTPLRAPIHDSLFMECPFRKVDQLLEHAFAVMLAPIACMPLRPHWGLGRYLTIGVEGKVGDTWDAMEVVETPQLAADGLYMPAEDAEEEETLELATVA